MAGHAHPFYDADENKTPDFPVRRVVEYQIRNAIPKNCYEPPDHQKLWWFLLCNTGGFHMKQHLTVALVAIPIWAATLPHGMAACQSMIQCRQSAGNNCNCCPTGTSETQYTCPDGWDARGSQCYRDATRSSDSIGYTETTYGTCAGTAGGFVQCYKAQCGTPIPNCKLL